MPVRSLSSPVLKWPSRERVLVAAGDWARSLLAAEPLVVRVGYFGSYARGDAGVGSDLDLVVIVREAAAERRFDVTRLPVPADVVVFTEARWAELSGAPSGLARTIAREAVWL
jgi:uncharacterized protein